MTRFRHRGTIRRMGNSLVLTIPAGTARKHQLSAGQTVLAEIDTDAAAEPILGFLKRRGVPYQPYSRRDEEPSDDRF